MKTPKVQTLRIDQDGEIALQCLADDLEHVAEMIHSRGWKGRKVSDLSDAPKLVRLSLQKLECLLASCAEGGK